MRRGMPYRAGDFEQFPGIGEDNPKASDHCPVFVDIPVAKLTWKGAAAEAAEDCTQRALELTCGGLAGSGAAWAARILVASALAASAP